MPRDMLSETCVYYDMKAERDARVMSTRENECWRKDVRALRVMRARGAAKEKRMFGVVENMSASARVRARRARVLLVNVIAEMTKTGGMSYALFYNCCCRHGHFVIRPVVFASACRVVWLLNPPNPPRPSEAPPNHAEMQRRQRNA